jgi:hypothetical protein
MSFSENEIIEQLALTRAASTSLALATSEKKNEIWDSESAPWKNW